VLFRFKVLQLSPPVID